MAIELTKEEVIECIDICSKDCDCGSCKLHGTDRVLDRDDMMCQDYLMKKAKEYLINETKEKSPKEKTQAEKNADAVKKMYDAFVKVGFEKDKAFDLTMTLLKR